mgnify:CR=1 FL=1
MSIYKQVAFWILECDDSFEEVLFLLKTCFTRKELKETYKDVLEHIEREM